MGKGARGRDATKYRDAEVSVLSSHEDVGRHGN
jgi:hypothetical protein